MIFLKESSGNFLKYKLDFNENFQRQMQIFYVPNAFYLNVCVHYIFLIPVLTENPRGGSHEVQK